MSATRTKTLNRREWPRYAAERDFVLAAKLDGQALFCTVADVSLGGARLVFDSDLPCPSFHGDAMLELSHPDAAAVHCATVWRGDKEVGIEFDFSEESLGLISICIRNIVDLHNQPTALAG